MRVKFKKGKQREFLELVLKYSGCPSLRNLISRGFEIPYSTLKSYYQERRLLPQRFFLQLCILSGLNEKDFDVEILGDNWGMVLGGER